MLVSLPTEIRVIVMHYTIWGPTVSRVISASSHSDASYNDLSFFKFVWPRTSIIFTKLDNGCFNVQRSAAQLPDVVVCSTGKGITSVRPSPKQRAEADFAAHWNLNRRPLNLQSCSLPLSYATELCHRAMSL